MVTDPEPDPVAYLRVDEAELEAKEGWRRPSVRELRGMLGLDGASALDDGGLQNLEALESWERKPSGPMAGIESSVEGLRLGEGHSRATRPRLYRRGKWFAASIDGETRSNEDVGDEIRRCFDEISGEPSRSDFSSIVQAFLASLSARGLSLPLHATHITLLLSDMALFATANAAYTTYFGTSPPSRATIAVPLPAGQRVKLDVVGFDDRPPTSDVRSAPAPARPASDIEDNKRLVGARQALHVQSLSYWAPANIGPYSQAVIVSVSSLILPENRE